MKINYANAHRWRKTLTESGSDGFGKNSINRIKSTLKKIDATSIRYEFKKLDQDFLDWFTPMYETRINEKDNPRVFNIKEKTLDTDRDYSYLALYEDERPLGATIFRITEDKICSIAYRTYSNKWTKEKLQANPSLLTEYLVCNYALEKGIFTVSHGKDRNPYGINSSIGLAAFKLSVGCHPITPDDFEISTISTDTLTEDALIFEYPGVEKTRTKHGYLITSRETEEKWSQVTKYPELIKVEVVYRN